MNHLFVNCLSCFALIFWSNMALANQIINIDSVLNDINNPITVNIKPTETLVLDVFGIADGGTFDAWSAWGANSNCDSMSPAMCENGWLWGFGVYADGDPSNAAPVSPVPGGIFEDPLDALASAKAAFPPGALGASGADFSSLSFFIQDDVLQGDNRGGISLNVRFIPDASVPLPSTIALFGLGFIGLGLTRRKKT